MRKEFGYIVLSMIMTSCSHYYHFIPNETPPIPENWDSEDDQYLNSDVDLPCLAWWKQFEDPALNDLIDEGLLHNNNIQVAVANIEAAHGELRRVQLNWIPVITANVGYSSFPDLGYPGVLAQVIPSYVINIFRQIEEQKKAGHELKATAAVHNAVRLTIITEIASSYFNYIEQIEELRLLTEIGNDLQFLTKVSTNLYQNGLYPRMNTEEAETELRLIESQKKLIQQNLVFYQNSLQYLLDKNPGKLNNASPFSQLNGKQMVIGSLPLNIIENRPDMVQAKEELKAANDKIGIAISELLPTIELRIARGEIATVPNGTTLGHAIHFNEALLEIPILKASAFGQIAKTKGLDKASYYRYVDTLRRVLRDVNNDLSAHDLYSKRLEDVEKAEKSLRQNYELNNRLHQQGITSHIDLIEKRIQLNKLTKELIKNKLEQFIVIVQLYQDLAAGYNYTARG